MISRDWDEAAELVAANHFSVLDAHGQMTDDALQVISHLSDLTAAQARRLEGAD